MIAAATPPPALVASRRHTAIVLAILAAITVAGVWQARAASAGTGPASSRVILYLSLVGLQLLWVRFVAAGMRRAGHSLSELTGRPLPSWRRAGADFLLGLTGFGVARLTLLLLARALGGVHAATAFLLPHGPLESALWIGVSMSAGISEEIVFRGYLQRQFTAISGSAAAALVAQAVLFGVSHGYQGWTPMVTTGTYGLVMGLLAWWRGDVRACAIAHATTDIIGGLL